MGQGQLGHWQSIKAARGPLQSDVRLRRGLVNAHGSAFGRAQHVPQPVCARHLIAIGVTGQPDLAVAALIAVDLRAAEGDTPGTWTAEPQIQMNSGEQGLVGRLAWIAEEQQLLEIHADQAQRILLRHTCSPGGRERRRHQIGERPARGPPERCRVDVQATDGQATVVVLPQGMIEGETGAGSRRFRPGLKDPGGQDVRGLEPLISRWCNDGIARQCADARHGPDTRQGA